MAESTGATTTSEAKVYIVYTEKPTGNKDPKVVHLRTLTSVLGSAEAAKNALVYTYKNAATGFAAKLTPEQAAVMSKQPSVFKVELSKTFHLNKASGVGGFRPH
ncbi:hypothetical protein AALP_AA2G150900 [Arabis alpina]|uniref:Inhibitor I9 domain-containing protein n=1 Tax=Arabis alpina TaxID=50452 RepID=A0A087HHK9_ARAAL|nr:hypothetical protein AALP_AA2G150900 [Arabis alpina]